jgi:glycosyltransferase involved in cell wall biosynthesis
MSSPRAACPIWSRCTPLLTAADPDPLRPELAALDGDTPVITTFGLISAGKGLDTALHALAQLVATHPDVRYVIAGQTDPEIVSHEGERYRSHLAALVDELGLSRHVTFIDDYLTVEELGALLRRSTVVLTPYRSPEQTCSGALTFALAAGRPDHATLPGRRPVRPRRGAARRRHVQHARLRRHVG